MFRPPERHRNGNSRTHMLKPLAFRRLSWSRLHAHLKRLCLRRKRHARRLKRSRLSAQIAKSKTAVHARNALKIKNLLLIVFLHNLRNFFNLDKIWIVGYETDNRRVGGVHANIFACQRVRSGGDSADRTDGCERTRNAKERRRRICKRTVFRVEHRYQRSNGYTVNFDVNIHSETV